MTTDDRVMTILERANPVPPDQIPDVAIGATRYLDDLQQRSDTVSIRTTDTSTTRRRWAMLGAAAAVVPVAVVAVFVIGNGDDDNIVVDTPDSVPATTTPTTDPDPTTPSTLAPRPGDTVERARAAVGSFFDVYNGGNTDDVLALMNDGVELSETYGATPRASGPGTTDLLEIENRLAWNHAQGDVWTEPTCVPADEQLPAGTTLSCVWDTLDAVVQAVDGNPIPTSALVVVSDEKVAELHLAYGSPAFATLGRPFGAWVAAYHPGVDVCCGEETREASEEQGRLRAQLASEWALYLDERDCEPQSCPFPVEEWVAIYDAQCVALDPIGIPDQSLVDRVRDLPAAASELLLTTQLADADAALLGPGLTDDRIAELQQQRLDAMIELGVDERCHPAVG